MSHARACWNVLLLGFCAIGFAGFFSACNQAGNAGGPADQIARSADGPNGSGTSTPPAAPLSLPPPPPPEASVKGKKIDHFSSPVLRGLARAAAAKGNYSVAAQAQRWAV